MRFFKTFRLLDVATGTADLAIEAARRHPGIRVAGVDFVREMLAAGRPKIAGRGLAGRINLLQADAMNLPFPDGSFDAVGIAFGIRNMPDRLRALREMRRVLVPGGRIFILEMNFPRNRLLPGVARLFSGNPAAYRYLADSILHFPAPQAFLEMMKEAGFRNPERYSPTFGITCLYVGRREEHPKERCGKHPFARTSGSHQLYPHVGRRSRFMRLGCGELPGDAL
jgi:demethylmenaquinone methyltransferase/2-methoxy-6-polyprenyl-1,4-benzoquinol methylase